jgi:leucyl aminopeptidase
LRRLAPFTLALALAATAAEARPIRFAADAPRGGAVVLPLGSEAELLTRGAALDPAARDALRRALVAARFEYKAGKTFSLREVHGYEQIVVLGAAGAQGPAALQDLGGLARRETAEANGAVALLAEGLDATQLAIGAELGGYAYPGLKAPPKRKPSDAPLVIVSGQAAEARAGFERQGAALAEGVRLARDLISEPSNIKTPQWFAERTREAFRGVGGATVEVFDEAELAKRGMNAILSVGQGSTRPPRLVVVEYKGPGATGRPVVITGKGITFDAGGVSIKPAAGMWRMRTDMSGAAAAVGAVLSLAKSKAPVHVVAVGAMAENMPGGGAARPGDVVRAYGGKSMERLNTDAEGRVVLADAIAYADERWKPAALFSVATLTGAVGTALGDDYAGLFSRHDGLADQVERAAATAGEAVWRLPLHESLAEDLKSPVADIRDVVEGGGAGASVGAHVIGFFADPATPWAHLDIASVAWSNEASPTAPKGARGWGVRLLDRFVRDFDPTRVK